MGYRDTPEDILGLVRSGEAHRDLYINQALFDLELAHVFRNTWSYVGHASQIPERGDYYTTTLANEPVVMVRRPDDSIHVLYNRCPHRGVKLVNEVHGNTGQYFRCPYHAWIFNTDGKLKAVPVKGGYSEPAFDASCASKGMARVKNVHVYRDFVFARLSAEGDTFEDFFGESLSSIDNMVDRSPEGRLEVAGAPLRYMNHCNWKMLVDNQTDTFHPMIAHESSAKTVKDLWDERGDTNAPKPMAVEVIVPFASSYDFFEKMGIRTWANGHGHTGTNFSIHSDYSDAPEYFDQMRDAYGEERAKEILGEARHNTIYFPNMMIKGPIQTLRLFKPLAADRTLVESWIFRLVGAPDYLLERTAMYNRLINAPTSIVGHDDTELYERAQEALHTTPNEWLNFQREESADEGSAPAQEYSGASEAQMRNQLRAWQKYMSTATAQVKGPA